MTLGRWAWKQPSVEDSVIARPRSLAAPKISGTNISNSPKRQKESSFHCL